MIQNQAREDIAFIRHAIEEGGAYARACSPDMLVWGVAGALGYLGTYAFLRGWSPVGPNPVWAVCIGLPWLFSLRRLVQGGFETRGPLAQAMSMLWFGCGVFLTTTWIMLLAGGEIGQGWFSATVAGVLGAAFFASAWLGNLPWLRWIAWGWWLGEVALFWLRHHIEMPLIAAALTLVLLAGPGWVLLSRRDARARE